MLVRSITVGSRKRRSDSFARIGWTRSTLLWPGLSICRLLHQGLPNTSPWFAMKIAGIVLCGGQSKRMGRPKAWLPFAGEIMLPRVVRLLGEVVRPIVVVATPEQDVPLLPDDVRIVRDEVRGRGHLQGLAAGLSALAGAADHAYLTSCDVPFLQPAFVRRLVGLLGEHHICVPRVGEFHHPLAAV